MAKASRSSLVNRISQTFPWLPRLQRWANRHEGLLILLLIVIALRLPSLAEPYWYGDEAIYLTIGNALRHGQRLYAEIVDHKTPFIYYLAMMPNQFSFRLLMLGWMLASTTFFYRLAENFFASSKAVWLSTLLFVLLTSWSSLEGNIPNGELFVMGFILAGLWIFSKSVFFQNFIKAENHVAKPRDYYLAFLAGAVSSGGILTKVPALFDTAAMGSVFIWLVMLSVLPAIFNKPGRRPNWLTSIKGGLVMVAGIILPLLLSVLYFWWRGSLDAYLQFGLLYNFHYTGNWNPPLNTDWLQWLFTLQGKGLVLLVGFFLSSFLVMAQPKFRRDAWLGWWLWLALFAALLSNRPYPHYFMQIVPPLSLLVIAWLDPKMKWFTRGVLVLPAVLAVAALYLLQFRLYPFKEYYANYLKLSFGQLSEEEYAQSFNSLVGQNDVVAQEIVDNSAADDHLFIWGTNPMLYALTKRVPANRFTVAFHIHDMNVYEESLAEIKTYKPIYIVKMKNEPDWPELESHLETHYIYALETADMILYRRSSLESLTLLQ